MDEGVLDNAQSPPANMCAMDNDRYKSAVLTTMVKSVTTNIWMQLPPGSLTIPPVETLANMRATVSNSLESRQ